MLRRASRRIAPHHVAPLRPAVQRNSTVFFIVIMLRAAAHRAAALLNSTQRIIPMNTKQLKDWRKQAGLTQVEAAKMIGCSRRALQNYEAGRRIPKNIA
ncbi:MAG TPA: helix-turn-helix transcriptional regulator, partial [Hyphomicrobiaceae bacterium]|nr:helix-turn-helix transcriptional regulator [Hyphomicrobiaceae bacterium]